MRVLLCLAAILSGVLVTAGARADPMTFTLVHSDDGVQYGEGSRDYIYAEGGFVGTTQNAPSTSKAFLDFVAKNPPKAPHPIVVLNSPGGNLGEGLELGLAIRKLHYWTQVGARLPNDMVSPYVPKDVVPYLPESTSAPFSGSCVSACTFAFLGGEQRFIDYGSEYGVHRFWSDNQSGAPETEVETQKITGELAEYLAEMGADPRWLTEMSKGGKTFAEVVHLSLERMIELRVVTPRWLTHSNYEIGDDGKYYLAVYTTNPWGDQEIDFSCYRPAGGESVLAATFHLEPGPRANASTIVGAVQRYVVEFDETSLPVGDDAVISKATLDNNGRLATTIQFPAKWLAVPDVVASNHIGFAFLFDPNAHLAMRLLQFESDFSSAQLKRFAGSCR